MAQVSRVRNRQFHKHWIQIVQNRCITTQTQPKTKWFNMDSNQVNTHN